MDIFEKVTPGLLTLNIKISPSDLNLFYTSIGLVLKNIVTYNSYTLIIVTLDLFC